MLVTFETKVRDRSIYPLLDAVADLYSRAEHRLFVDLYVKGRPLKELKQEYLLSFGLTARQFNAISTTVRGKVEATWASLNRRMKTLKGQIESTEKTLKEIEKEISKPEKKPAAKASLRFRFHQKKRRLSRLRDELCRAEKEAKRGAPGLCFGSRRLFRAQFYLEENGYTSHGEWLSEWQGVRASQFFCLGSKDETAGNQTCTLLSGGALRLRVPNALTSTFDHWVIIREVYFPYGQAVIERALFLGRAITYRFTRRRKKKGRSIERSYVWYVQATTEREDIEVQTRPSLGALGVDLNPNLSFKGVLELETKI